MQEAPCLVDGALYHLCRTRDGAILPQMQPVMAPALSVSIVEELLQKHGSMHTRRFGAPARQPAVALADAQCLCLLSKLCMPSCVSLCFCRDIWCARAHCGCNIMGQLCACSPAVAALRICITFAAWKQVLMVFLVINICKGCRTPRWFNKLTVNMIKSALGSGKSRNLWCNCSTC